MPDMMSGDGGMGTGPGTGMGSGSPSTNPAAPTSGLFSGVTDSLRSGMDTLKRLGGPLRQPSLYEDQQKILQVFKDFKKLCFEDRPGFERTWQQYINYERNRQWQYFNSRAGEWQDKRLARWVPKPVINKCAESVNALCSMFADAKLGVKCKPRGESPKNLATATVADVLEPFIAEEHEMDSAQEIFDHNLVLLGNAWYHPYWERDPHGHKEMLPAVTCQTCRTPATWDLSPDDPCPQCGKPMTFATGPSGALVQREEILGRGRTVALSPFELAFPFSTQVWEDVPGVIRLRWRDQSYYEQHPDLKAFAKKISFSGESKERSLSLWRGFSLMNDMGGSSSSGAGRAPEGKGIGEYEMWLKPTDDFPKGLVVRITDDEQIVPLELSEGLPGPFPLTDQEGTPVFPFVHCPFKKVSGRILGASSLATVITVQDQINQLMSLVQMIVQRTANPIWLEEKGAEVEKFTGEPGIVVKWNSFGGTKEPPTRIAGENIPQTLFTLMEQLYKIFEEEIGTFDIIKGQKPTGVEAFSALQLLVERSQGRFSSIFKARARAHLDWYAISLELERKFGPRKRAEATLGPNRGYIFQHFQKAQLSGAVTFVIEDGSTTPKTTLGVRAGLEQAKQMGLLNVQDPDQRYFALKTLGVPELDPALDVQVQAAHRKQDAFEAYLRDKTFLRDAQGTGMPLVLEKWHEPTVHLRECVKWANSDGMVDLFTEIPPAKDLVSAYIDSINLMLGIGPDGQPIVTPGTPGTPGASVPRSQNGGAMNNSVRETNSTDSVPSGNGQGAQNM